MVDPQERKISMMIDAMTKIAMADGKITNEEKELLHNVQINLLLYDQSLEKALDDGIIDERESEILEAFKMNILNGAWDIAKVSEGVSEDELKILEVILNKLTSSEE